MTERTAIEWADSTFNPWVGCTKVSPACDHCYAEAMMDTRLGRVLWGAGKKRARTSDANWRQPLKWNRTKFGQCRHCGWRGEYREPAGDKVAFPCPGCGVAVNWALPARRRVFCASLADVFDNEVPVAWRIELFSLILSTPNLDWLLLTKRIGNAERMIDEAGGWAGIGSDGSRRNPLPNVWLGATICNQEEADRDIPKLIATHAAVRFVSIEPILGPITLNRQRHRKDAAAQSLDFSSVRWSQIRDVDWVIAGGESGPHARPAHPDWFRSLRNQCAAEGVAFLFKQWGEWASVSEVEGPGAHHRFPDGATVRRTGKKAAGRLLDGIEHNGFPESQA